MSASNPDSRPGPRPGRDASALDQALALFAKDLRLELRSRAAVNAIFLFAVTALVVIAGAIQGVG